MVWVAEEITKGVVVIKICGDAGKVKGVEFKDGGGDVCDRAVG